MDMYLVLTRTAHGKPYYQWTKEPDTVRLDLGLNEALPRKVVGPFLIGEDGYASTDEAVLALDVDLNDPDTWFD